MTPFEPSESAPQPPPEAAGTSYPTLEELAELLPQYEMHAVVGVGGMGAVYKARQVALDRWVAIKVLPAAASQNPEDTARFIKEARAMARLVHPHIVAVFDFGQTYGGHLYLVMEYVEGNDLHRRTRAGEINPARAREIIAQLCDALQFAHDQGVAHRDIKPANLLITDQWKLKVADFGLARELSAQPNADEPEYGTPDYTAPERLIIGAVVDHRADIYALGVVIHEMLTGRTPAAAGTVHEGSLPPGFAPVISKCLMKEPEQRFQRALEVKVALLTATAESGQGLSTSRGATSKTLPRVAPVTRREDSPSALGRLLGPVGWGLASVLVVGVLGWLVIRNKMDQNAPVARTPAGLPRNTDAGAGDLAVFSTTAPAATEPVTAPASPAMATAPATEPVAGTAAPASAMVAVAAPAPAPPEVAAPAPPAEPLSPFEMPEGERGEVLRLEGHTNPVSMLRLLKDGRRLVSSSTDGTLRVWDLVKKTSILTIDAGIGQISSFVLDRDEALVLACSLSTDKVALIELATGKVKAVADAPNNRLTRAVISPGGTKVLLATTTNSGPTLFLWNLAAPDEPMSPVPESAGDMIADLHPVEDGREIAAIGMLASSAGGAQVAATGIYDFATSKYRVASIPLKAGALTRLTVSPTRKLAVLDTGTTGQLQIVKWPGLEPDVELPLKIRPLTPNTVAAINHPGALLVDNDRLVITAWSDGTLRVHEAATGAEVHQMVSSTLLGGLILSPDQRWIAAGGRGLVQAASGQGLYDVVVWRLPSWKAFMSQAAMEAMAMEQMDALDSTDPELAALRKQAEADLAAMNTTAGQELENLNALYVAALRRAVPGRSPTEQNALNAEVERVGLNQVPSPDALDRSLPVLKNLRGIYHTQLAALNAKIQTAGHEAKMKVEDQFAAFMLKREEAGDKLGVVRAKLVKQVLLNAAAQQSTGAFVPTSSATPVQRPDRAGSLVVIPRRMQGLALEDTSGVRNLPADIGRVVAIAGGPSHMVALRQDGSVCGWGTWGQRPFAVPGHVVDVVKVDSSQDTVAALMKDGRIVVWHLGGTDEILYRSPRQGRAFLNVYAGLKGEVAALQTDGTLVNFTIGAWNPGTSSFRFATYVPTGGLLAVTSRGSPASFGVHPSSVVPFPPDLRDVKQIQSGRAFAVALKIDGTLQGWGTIAQGQSYRTRRFVDALEIVRDYGDRLFPVHRGDHAWELITNPSTPSTMGEESPTQIESGLSRCVQAVFCASTVIGLRLD